MLAQMDIESLTKLAFGITGGLGIFLLGMKNMSEGMQAVAGTGLRRMIGLATDNRLLAAGVGTIVTTVIQSSSITTVMVVGFVNSGVMALNQAIGVIMGANIGTTITGWIVTLPIGKYGLPLLGFAAFIYLFAKGDRWRYWAMFFMGVGMVFFGLVLMKDACKVIREVPEFESWFHRFRADGPVGLIMCQLVGCILTMLVQSSSATLTITISLATQGVIPYETAAALVLGENLGTTVTAYLASLGATTVARRAAYFHVIFNLLGVCWITLLFPWYTEFIQSAITTGVDRQIAATHTIFNVVNTLAFLPFVPLFGRLLVRLVPGKAFKEKPKLTDLDVHMLETPGLAIEQSRFEILKMGDGCSKMMAWLGELVDQQDQDKALSDRLRHREKVLDTVQDEITHFVTDLLAGSVPHSVAEEARQQLRLADEYESISDYIDSILKSDQRLRKDELRLTEKQREGLRQLHHGVAAYMDTINQAYRDQNPNAYAKLDVSAKEIKRQIKSLRREHLDDLSTESVPPQVSVAFLAALNAYARVRDHAQNIGEVIAGEK